LLHGFRVHPQRKGKKHCLNVLFLYFGEFQVVVFIWISPLNYCLVGLHWHSFKRENIKRVFVFALLFLLVIVHSLCLFETEYIEG
jgi:hypothetical protein